jgi:hypothetical protein
MSMKRAGLLGSLLVASLASSAIGSEKGAAVDSFEPDDDFLSATFLAGFDFLTDGPLIEDQQHFFDGVDDEDWVSSAQTFNYPTAWVGDDPNTTLTVRACDGVCDAGPDLLALNVAVFDETLIDNPAAAPLFEMNACPGTLGDLAARAFPNDLADKFYFIRVRECGGQFGASLPYRLILSRDSVGIDIHIISGRVTVMNSASQRVPVAPLAVVTTDFNDLTYSNPATGEFQLAVLAANPSSGTPIPNLQLSAGLPSLFEQGLDVHTVTVTGLSDGGTSFVELQLNLFRSGFE